MSALGNRNGFTLMEMMVSMAIFSIVIAGVVNSRLQQSTQHVTQLQVVEMQQSSRSVMFLIKRRIRMAGFNPYTDGTFNTGITTADAGELTFSYVDTDDLDVETVTYLLEDDDGDGDTDITIDGVMLAENIDALSFTYYDGSGNILATPVANPGNIRWVDITITAAPDSDELAMETSWGAGESRSRTLTSTLCLRNMGL